MIALTFGIIALIGYGIFAYTKWDDMSCHDSDRDKYCHKSKIRIVSGIFIILFISIIEIVTPSKATVYAAAGANLAEQIEKNTNIPKRIDDLLDAIEVNLKNNTNTKTE